MKKFKNTSEIEPYDGIIGQQRAEKAMQFGLKMNNPAYNIYVSGNCGSGRITYTIKAIESQQIDESKIIIGTDGCGVPVHGMPLYNAALAFSKFTFTDDLQPEL